MGWKISGHASAMRRSTVMGVLVVMLIMVVKVRAGIYYYCWGGCLNQCVLLSGKAPADNLPCYMNCVNNCMTRPSSIVGVDPRPPNSDTSPPDTPDKTSSSSTSSSSSSSSSTTSQRPPQYYCWLGCTLETCMPVSRDAAELKTCLGSCSTLCKP